VSADEPREESSGKSFPSGESFRARRQPTGPIPEHADDTRTSIIRRQPTGPIPEHADDTRTSIIRRQPTGPIPKPAVELPTAFVPEAADEPATSMVRQAPRRIAGPPQPPSPATAMASATLNIVNGWATAVIATDLITGWWRTDRLFCVGVGFLTAVCAAAIIAGVFQLLLRRRVGVYLTLVGAVLSVLIFAGIFVTGAHVAGVVRAMPVLPAAAAFFAMLPATWRWTRRA
jgi:hypothetical protein